MMEKFFRFTGSVILTVLIMLLIDGTPLVNFLAIMTIGRIVSSVFDPPNQTKKPERDDDDEDDHDEGDSVRSTDHHRGTVSM